jgi:isocitrate lyase
MYNTPIKYKKVFPMFNIMLEILKQDALQKDRVNDIYYHLKKYIDIAFEKCSVNENYCNDWLLWFEKKGNTLLIRCLFNSVRCNYWKNLINGNAIDWLDSLQCEINKKIKENENL